MRGLTYGLLGVLGVLASPATAQAPDPVPLYPDNYRVLVENDRVRVLDFTLRKGATEVPHRHPAHVLYVLQGFKVRFTLGDGSVRTRDVRAGEVLYSDAVVHSPENIGDSDAHGILIELKSPHGAEAAAGAGMADPLTAFTFIRGLPGQGDSLQQHLLSLTAPTRAEPGAIRYDLYRSVERPDDFIRHEVWADKAALERHKATPHLRESFSRRQREGWSTEITLWHPGE